MSEYRCGTFYKKILDSHDIPIIRTVFIKGDRYIPIFIISEQDAAFLKLSEPNMSIMLHKDDRDRDDSKARMKTWQKNPHARILMVEFINPE